MPSKLFLISLHQMLCVYYCYLLLRCCLSVHITGSQLFRFNLQSLTQHVFQFQFSVTFSACFFLYRQVCTVRSWWWCQRRSYTRLFKNYFCMFGKSNVLERISDANYITAAPQHKDNNVEYVVHAFYAKSLLVYILLLFIQYFISR